jgi:hypothetical protein
MVSLSQGDLVPTTDYLPIIDVSEPSPANRNKRITAASIVLGTLTSNPVRSVAGSASAPTYSFASDDNTGMYSPLADHIAFSTFGVARFTIGNTGSTAIGTTDIASATLRVRASAVSAGEAIRAETSNTSAGTTVSNFIHAATSGDNTFANFAWGDLSTPTFVGSITFNRGGGLTAFNTTSDYRLKAVYGPVPDALAALELLPVKLGRMHGASVDRPMFVAHELQARAPYAVTGEKDAVDAEGKPVYQQVDHSALVPLLVAAVQELSQRVRALEVRLQSAS